MQVKIKNLWISYGQKFLFYCPCGVCEQYADFNGLVCKACLYDFLKKIKKGRELESAACLYVKDMGYYLSLLRKREENPFGKKLWMRALTYHPGLNQLLQNWQPEILMTVPSRQSENGFSAMENLISSYAKKIQVPFLRKVLIKDKKVSQHERQAKDRLNGETFIGLSKAVKDSNAIRGKRILLFDDVFTTGTSLLQSELVLLDAGAKEVKFFTLCHRTLGKAPALPL